MSAFHEEIVELDWSCSKRSESTYDPQQFIGLAYVVLFPDEYIRFVMQDGFDFIGRQDYVFMNFHIEPMEALTFKAYPEYSRHASQPLCQRVPLRWHFNIDHFAVGKARASLFSRYGQDAT